MKRSFTPEESPGLTINNAYPWGRTLEEYQGLFHLTEPDLHRRILGVGDGPAAFNATMHGLGRNVVSCDPLYGFTREEIACRIEAAYPILVEAAERSRHRFVWDRIASPEDLGRIRMGAMSIFLADYESGRADGRYVPASLPSLPFPDASFDLALCSHFLFLYSDDFTLESHEQSILEMSRVASEVRIFPLLDMSGSPSIHVAPLLRQLPKHGLKAVIETVPYEFQRNGNKMMRITHTP